MRPGMVLARPFAVCRRSGLAGVRGSVACIGETFHRSLRAVDGAGSAGRGRAQRLWLGIGEIAQILIVDGPVGASVDCGPDRLRRFASLHEDGFGRSKGESGQWRQRRGELLGCCWLAGAVEVAVLVAGLAVLGSVVASAGREWSGWQRLLGGVLSRLLRLVLSHILVQLLDQAQG